MIEFDREESQPTSLATIKVVGIGGAGGNTINCMVDSGYKGVDFVAINTDAQALRDSRADVKIQIGQKSTKGLGAGANPEVGKRAAEEDIDKVMEELHGADIVFVTGGMGGGTGSGAIPVIAKALKEKGILTIVIVTKPFGFEGKRRAKVAQSAISDIKQYADTLLIIPNQKLLDLVDDQVSMIDGFGMINEVLNQSVRGISDIITKAGHINVDFADVREIMRDQGLAVMGTARASGENRARRAAIQAISSPLLENMNIAGAKGVLLNITGGLDLGLKEISEAASVIYEQADQNANIILGSVIDREIGDEISVTVIATGFDESCPVEASALPTATRAPEPKQEVAAAPVVQPVEIEHHAEQPVIEIKIEAQPVKTAQEAHTLKAQVPAQEQKPQERPTDRPGYVPDAKGSINVKDLDVPAFMRKNLQQKQHKND